MKSNLYNILKKEIREMFRDKKSLIMMLIIPLFIPLLIIGMSALFENQINKEVNQYNKIGVTYELEESEKIIAKEMDIELITGTEKDLKEKYEKGKITLYLTKENNKYIINSDGSEISAYGEGLVERYLNVYKEYLQKEYLDSKNIKSEELINIITIETNIFEKDNFFSSYIKNYAFLFIIMAITVSATYPATDTTAGEKERGTLETLLTFPIKSKDIILGKFLGVTISSIITGFISLLLAMVSLKITQNMFVIYEEISIIYSLTTFIFAIIIIIIYSIFISGLCISIASKSKTFKEAQSALTPLTFISFFPGMIAFMIGIETTTILSLIPFLNFTMLFIDVNNGNINYLNIILMLVSSIVYISLILYYIIGQYKSEKILFSK